MRQAVLCAVGLKLGAFDAKKSSGQAGPGGFILVAPDSWGSARFSYRQITLLAPVCRCPGISCFTCLLVKPLKFREVLAMHSKVEVVIHALSPVV